MRRDLLVTALIFSVVGFMAGALFTGAIGGARPASPVLSPPVVQSSSPEGLPEGHPPLELAERWQELRERAESNPDDVGAAVELANFLYDQGSWEQAAVWYEKALALNPRDTSVRTDYATSLYNQGRAGEAIAEYGAALRDEPDKPQALYGLARAKLEAEQDRDAAEKLYEQLRRAHPEFEGVRLLAALLAETKLGE